MNLISRIIDSGLIRRGRRLRLNVLISDRTGSLNRLTSLIAEIGGNVLQAIHDRNQPGVRLDQTSVALTIETRGPEQSQKLVEEIQKIVDFVEVFDV